MVRKTYSATASKVNENADTLQMYVPAEVQRDEGICIDTSVQVTLHNLDGLFDEVSFTNRQRAGDVITIPAELARKVGLDGDREYQATFEKVEDDEEPDEATDEEVEEPLGDSPGTVEDDGGDTLDDLLDDLESGLEDDESDGEEQEEEHSLGELFGRSTSHFFLFVDNITLRYRTDLRP